MVNSNNKQSVGMISKAFGVAKKLSSVGFELAQHVAPGSVSRLTQQTEPEKIIEIKLNENHMSDQKKYDKPQQLIREHVPQVTQQLFGRHYSKINNIASFISPDLNNRIADYFFDRLNVFVSDLSSVEHVLNEAGAKSLDELKGSVERSDRIGYALENQNKMIAAFQGAVTGATGVIGTAIDIPFSLALTLRSIYQEGRAHGFELETAAQQNIVEYVFKQVDFGSIAEKQTLLVAVRAVANLLKTQDTQQLQQLLGSSNDFSVLKQWLSDENGGYKWSWLNRIPQVSILSRLTPVAGAGIGAAYSWKLVEEAHQKARTIFASAQQYLIQHPDEGVDLIQAYEKHQAQLAAIESQAEEVAQPLLEVKAVAADLQQEIQQFADKIDSDDSIQVEQEAVSNAAIADIKIEAKPVAADVKTESIEDGLKKLADQHVEKKADEAQTSAVGKSATAKKTTVKERSVKKTTAAADAQIAQGEADTTDTTAAKPKTRHSAKKITETSVDQKPVAETPKSADK